MGALRSGQIPVKIHIKTAIDQGDGTETYELIAFGRYQKTDSAQYLRYEEAMEVGNVNTTLKITEEEMLILRNGPVKMRMTFRLGQPISGTYSTPLGFMEIVTEAKKLHYSINETERAGTVSLKYDLTVQGALAGTYQLEINFKEEGK